MSSAGNWWNFSGNLAEMANEMVPFKVGTKVLQYISNMEKERQSHTKERLLNMIYSTNYIQ
jgi:hypothetical protein